MLAHFYLLIKKLPPLIMTLSLFSVCAFLTSLSSNIKTEGLLAPTRTNQVIQISVLCLHLYFWFIFVLAFFFFFFLNSESVVVVFLCCLYLTEWLLAHLKFCVKYSKFPASVSIKSISKQKALQKLLQCLNGTTF